MTTRPMDKDYAPRKGDKLLVEVTVKYDQHSTEPDQTIHTEHRYASVSVKRADVHGITHLQLEPGDYVTLPNHRIGKVEHIHESYALVSFSGVYPPALLRLNELNRAPADIQEKDVALVRESA